MLTLENILFNQYKVMHSPVDGRVDGRIYLTYGHPGPKQMGIANPGKLIKFSFPFGGMVKSKVFFFFFKLKSTY